MSESVPPETKAEIADAVGAALAEHGYERLTTAKIAAEYDKSEAALYYHYDSKDEMIAVFLERAAESVGTGLPDASEVGPERRLRALCDGLFLSPGDERAAVHVAVMELLSHAPYNEILREPLRELERTTLATIADVVREGVDQGVFRPVDPDATAAFLLAAADGSTGFYVALELDVGDDLHAGWSGYVDSLLVDD